MPAHASTEKWATLSSTSRLVAGITGGSVAVLGLAVLLGWSATSVALVQVRPSLAPMQINTALGFLLCGLSLVMLAAGRGRHGGRLGLDRVLFRRDPHPPSGQTVSGG